MVMKQNSLKNLSIIILVLGLTLAYSIYEREKVVHLYNSDDKVLMVEKLPEFTFENLEGEKLTSIELEKSTDLLILHFWGTWCPPCIPEFPEFLKYAGKFEKMKKVKFVVVAVNDTKEAVKKFLRSTPVIPKNVVLAIDPKGEGMNSFGTVKVPETHYYLNGKSTKRFLGPQEWKNEFYDKFVKDVI